MVSALCRAVSVDSRVDCYRGLIPDQPKGYIQRVGLGVFGFALFGSGLGHLGYMANDWNYRPILLLTIFAVELNDIFAYICGHSFGHRKFVPNTSPNKTVGGALGAIALTTPLFAVGAHFVWSGTALDTPVRLVGLGIIVSIVGQFGDLMLSSIKRDLGLKDTAKLIPGHGGILDRFDSLILVAPAVFHYVNYFAGIAVGQPQQIFSGWQIDGTLESSAARDTGLTRASDFASVRRESGLLESLAHHLCFSLSRSYFAIAHRLTIMGRDNLPKQGPFVLASEPLQSSRRSGSGRSASPAPSRKRFSHRSRRCFLSNQCDQHVLGNHAQRLADVAEKLWPARACRFAPEITGRKIHLHHLPGRWTQP